MYHGIKYKGLRYKLFSFRWKRKNRNWKDCPKKRKAMKKDWEIIRVKSVSGTPWFTIIVSPAMERSLKWGLSFIIF